jgi:transposase
VYQDMSMWSEIRRRVLAEKASKRAICREYNIHWDTLKKILEHEEPPGYRRKQARAKPVLGPFLPIIHEILEQDRKAPPKQRHTARRIFHRLRKDHGYTGGETVVKQAVRVWRRGQAEVFVPLSHLPAHAQADFGEATVQISGEPVKVALFVMTLLYSDAIFCQVFPRECTETFQEGHRRAFEFFDGVPRRISYDNSKIAVAKIVGRRGKTPTREFSRLQSHYLFEHHFCLVRRANEKGHVESLLGFARRNFLVPVPEVESLEALNAALAGRCREDLERRLRGKPATKAELLAEEQQQRLPLPKQPFEARRVEMAKANSLSLVRFDCNDYSVPTEYGHHPVTAVGGIEEVRLVVDDRVVACHRRCWGREQVFFDPRHYLALLERKPGAFDHARPLQNWELPECFWTLRRRQEAELDRQGTREFIKVLRLLESAGLGQLTAAVERALAIGATSADAIRLILQCGREKPTRWFRLDGRPHLAAVHVPAPDLRAYSSLSVGGGA